MGWFICLSGIGRQGVWRPGSSRWGGIVLGCRRGRGERHHQDVAVDFGDHQPVGGWFGGVEHRVGSPDFADVPDAQARVLEQVGGLSLDLERILFVEQIQIEQPVCHLPTVIQTDTNGHPVGDFARLSRSLGFDDSFDDDGCSESLPMRANSVPLESSASRGTASIIST
jgi:hypothetical protein